MGFLYLERLMTFRRFAMLTIVPALFSSCEPAESEPSALAVQTADSAFATLTPPPTGPVRGCPVGNGQPVQDTLDPGEPELVLQIPPHRFRIPASAVPVGDLPKTFRMSLLPTDMLIFDLQAVGDPTYDFVPSTDPANQATLRVVIPPTCAPHDPTELRLVRFRPGSTGTPMPGTANGAVFEAPVPGLSLFVLGEP